MSNDTIAQTSVPTALDIVQSVYASFGRGDVAAVLDLIDDDVDWGRTIQAPGATVVPHLQHGIGKAAAISYFTAVAETMEFHRFSPHLFATDGAEHVMAVLDLDMTVRTTGARVAFDEVHVFTVRNGKIVRYRPFLDTAQLIEAYSKTG